MGKILKLLAILLAAVLIFGAAWFLDNGPTGEIPEIPETQPWTTAATAPETLPQVPSVPETTAAVETEPEDQRFLLTFVGDCTLGCRDSHSYMNFGFTKTIGEDYGFPFRYVLDYFAQDEMTFINLEGTFCDTGNPVQKAHTFRGPTSYINILTENSVEAVTLANNHSMDYGQSGYDSTKAVLESAGIPYAERDSSTIITTENGLTIGIYGAVYYLMDTEVITAAIRDLREQADIVIFAPHWGFEKNPNYNETQEALAHAVIDAGADLIWGSHPHVLQSIEDYNGGKIFYSLGNFSFGGNIYPEDYDSALIQQEVIRSADGTVSLGETIVVPVRISSIPDRNNFQPVPYEEGSEDYVRVLKKLGLPEEN